MIACSAMWSYMSYGRNGSTAPSIHDIFVGRWTPNTAESAAGYLSTQPINAVLGVVASQAQKSTGNGMDATCLDFYIKKAESTVQNGRNLGDLYF